MKKLRIKLIRSSIGRPEKHKKVVLGLGLKKLNRTVIKDDTPAIRGMIDKVHYLVKVQEIQ